MKTVIWIRLFLFSAMVAGAFRAAEARNVRPLSPEPADSLLNPPLMKDAERILRFDRTVLDVGTLTEDDAPQSCRFTATNVSGKPVSLSRVRATCGCVKPVFTAGELLPGEKTVIELVYYPKNHPGTIDIQTFVYLASAHPAPVARLTLRGNVLPGADVWDRFPYAMGSLRLKQNRMEFREVTPGRRPSARILCGNSGDKPLRLSASALPAFATFRTEPEEIAPGEEADVVVTIDASLIPAGKGNVFTFPVTIEGVDGEPSERTLNIKVNRSK